jgi:hypothetical protein
VKIKLIDDRGRTVCVFEWFARLEMTLPDGSTDVSEAHWMAISKPTNRKRERHIMAEIEADTFSIPRRSNSPPHSVQFQENRPTRLVVPGLILRWEKVTAVLDKLAAQFAEHDTLTLTINQLRSLAQRSDTV